MTTVKIVTVDLREQAAAEVLRLTASRTVAGDDDEAALAHLEGDGPWTAVARGAHRRRALGRRVLLVWRVTCEDACGGLVDSCLVPIVVELSAIPARFSRRACIEAIAGDADADIRAQIESATVDWRRSVELVSRAFSAARVSREHAIATRTVEAANRPFQPGLFDRRADRSRELRVAAIAANRRAVAERLATLEQRTAAASASSRLLLALLP